MPSERHNAIAIIGMGCRFPGGVTNPDALWDLLQRDGDAIVDVPSDRWSTERYYSADVNTPGKTYVQRAGFLREPVDRFDPLFFGISPREAQHMDPQQRLLLEVAWECMEEAGLIPAELAGSRTGVYVGGFALDAMTIMMSPLARHLIDTHHAATAASMTMLAARLSYIFDFRGPSVTMDTACSSSLVALHYACRALIEGECDLAMAGGVNVMLSAEYPIIMSKGHFLARDGHCKSFDAKADGYSRGEGCGIVLVKRLEDALRDGDHIHAVVRGTGVNQDGRTDGITVPSAEAQEALIRRVYAKANVPLDSVAYVEAHGTGTPIGDPIEAQALGRTIGADRDDKDALIIGSVKANIGHLEAAAGVAGLIKAALCLKHGTVPRQIHLDSPNPAIPFAQLGLKLPMTALPLSGTGGAPTVAGVNSFGYGGTNAHAILAAHPRPQLAGASEPRDDVDGACLLPISARTDGALRLMAAAYADALSTSATEPARPFAAASALYRSHFDHRLAVRGRTRADLAAKLQDFLANGAGAGVTVGRSQGNRGVAFVFSGMGPQWWGMGHALLDAEPVFRAAADAIDRIFKDLAGWSILDAMRVPEAASRMHETSVAQPANFVLQVALSALLDSRGVVPSAIVGHSVGEVAAAYVAGALDLADAVRVVYHRSRLQQTTAGSGTMLAVGLGADSIGRWIEGRGEAVSIAAINGPHAVTLAGEQAVLQLIADSLADEGVFHRFLQVEVPYHSPLMEALRDPLIASLRAIEPRAPRIPLYSTVTGERWSDTESHDGAYWFRNLRDPVLFAGALDRLITDGYALFAEIGPNPVLSSSIRDGLAAKGLPDGSVYSLRRKDDEATRVLAMIGELYVHGFVPDWRRLSGDAPRSLALPTYRWDRVQFWSESAAGRADRLGVEGHPLLGSPLSLATGRVWTADINGNYLPWLRDHKIDEAVVFPGAAYVDACLALHKATEGTEPAIIEHLELASALMLSPDAGVEMQWTFDAKTRAVTASSRAHGSDGLWQNHASAAVLASAPWPSSPRDLAAIEARCPTLIDIPAFYDALAARSLNYGPAFRCVRALRTGRGEALATLSLSDMATRGSDPYRAHPALLDAALQTLIAICGDGGADTALFMPVGMRQILFHAPLGTAVRAHCRLVGQTGDAIEGDIVLFDDQGSVLLDLKGVRCKAVGRRGTDAVIPLDEWMYEYVWEQTEPAVAFAEAATWTVFADSAAVGASLGKYLQRQGATRVIEVVPGETFARLSENRFQIRRGSPLDMAALQADPALAASRAIVHLWGSDDALNDGTTDPTGLQAVTDVMVLVQALTDGQTITGTPPRLYVATRDARHVDPSRPVTGLHQAALVGFLRVVALEHPDVRATLIDLDADMPVAAAGRRLGQEILANTAEDDVALRGAGRFVHRLTRRPSRAASDVLVPITGLDREPAYKLDIAVPGSIDKVRFAEVPRPAPGEQEIELRIRSAGLNFKDVLKVLGVMSEAALEGTHCHDTLGMEASAVVSAVGPGVTGYKVGDEIVALVAGCLASHLTVRVDELLSLPRPRHVGAAEAATIPVTFMTAFYGLVEAARLRKGDTVLIHAGAGGVGMAAIQIAKWIGATIFATAGSPEKRDLLLGLGVARVWDSRSLEFVDGIKEATGGRGVDVVLNSLSGEAMERSFEALAPLGRFVEIGKRDIIERSHLPMAGFDRSVSFSSLDLDRLMLTRPDVIRQLFHDIWDRFEAGDFVPLPLTRFPASNAAEALRFMAQAKHVGKVVIDFDEADGVVLAPRAAAKEHIRADATYLVTGGFGGFGLELARVLAAKGARHLALVGRSGAGSAAARAMLADLRRDGITIREAKVDIADEAAVTNLLAEIGATMPPLAGVFHAAAVLDDAFIGNLDPDRLRRVLAPKALGALVLHEATKHLPLDLFVLFSSATSLIGNLGQASYVAANTVLDSLAQQRRAQGLAATAVNWGAIGGVGMLAQDNAASAQLDLAGVHQIPVADALTALFQVLDLETSVVSVMNVEWSAWMKMCPGAAAIPRFSALAREATSATAGANYRSSLLALPSAERLAVLTTAIIALVADALKVPAEKIDGRQPLSELGIDSLVGVELQGAINVKLGAQISILQLMRGGNIEEMAALLLQKMNAGPVPDSVPAETPAASADMSPAAIVPSAARGEIAA